MTWDCGDTDGDSDIGDGDIDGGGDTVSGDTDNSGDAGGNYDTGGDGHNGGSSDTDGNGDTGGDIGGCDPCTRGDTNSGNLAYLSVSGERAAPLLPAIRADICKE